MLTNVDVRERVSELQHPAARSTADALILNRERVLHRLSQLSNEAQQKGQYSAAARCEELIGKEIGMFVGRRETVIWDGTLSSLSGPQLLRLEEQLIHSAFSGDPVKMAEFQKQLDAGPVVIDGESTAVETRSPVRP